ncbi:serine/threonine-protein kinase Nek4 isoform X1 [Hemiscyllium ocellatum]|uniref:serine/threonine-protein kinase Nek4 isoform X1 n=1 Tax=Hemiscyllium ocellatum TaxID=170820 RepID=UPI0029665653|nr:serine/threonine-protein kinase Nek4 isoform X1 [Hemiscyllium ocellatum]XP_060691113.1 serine/threonine-protein kinase Nek4 isoform X1 [Hemiscyllium ocellatum]
MERYLVIRIVGKGSYGEVQLVRHGSEGKQYVVKKLNLRNVSSRERKAAEQEAQLLSQLRHPNIVTYRESWEGDDGLLYIVMGYCEGGDLYHKLKEQKGKLLPESQIVEWFVQIAMALQYLHEKHILHRDLKTQNIFLTKTNIIKVGDLGIARVLESQHDMASTLIGTPYYMSPELFCNKPYNHKSDIWALGCCVFEMATLKHAFNAKDMNSLVFKIIEGKLPPIPMEYSEQLGVLIHSMLSKKPEERPDVKAVLRKSYIKSHIALFLEATKVRAMKTRKKTSLESKPINSSTVTLKRNSQCESDVPLDMDPTKKYIKEEKTVLKSKPYDKTCDHQEKEKYSDISHQTLNSTANSVASISKLDINIVHGSEGKNTNSDGTVVAEPLSNLKGCLNEGAKIPVGCAQADYTELHNGVMLKEKSDNQTLSEFSDGKNDTIELIQPALREEQSSEMQEIFDSTEKLLQPFVPVRVTDDPSEKVTKQSLRDPVPYLPHCSSSEPSISRQCRQKNNELAKKTEKVKASAPRQLPALPHDEPNVYIKKLQNNPDKIVTSVANSKSNEIGASQDRPLSARERRRLKQSKENFPHSVSTSRRSSHCGALEANSYTENQMVKVSQSLSDITTYHGKVMSESSPHLSDDDEYCSSTSSTDKSEGDCKEVKSDSNEMHDLVKLMTQTLSMDSKDMYRENLMPAPKPEFRLQRRYRDTLILHGKAKEDLEDFCFNDFPTEVLSVPEKIKRTIQALRTDVVKGLGVKLLEKVYNIMEDADEKRREECLQEHMGEELYQNYSMKVQQLKFFEDHSNF